MSDYIYHIEDSAGNVHTCMADGHRLDAGVLVLEGSTEYYAGIPYRDLIAGYAGWSKFWRTASED